MKIFLLYASLAFALIAKVEYSETGITISCPKGKMFVESTKDAIPLASFYCNTNGKVAIKR